MSYNPGATNGTCEEVEAYHGFICKDLHNSKSIWRKLSFESLDANRMEMIFRPF